MEIANWNYVLVGISVFIALMFALVPKGHNFFKLKGLHNQNIKSKLPAKLINA